MMIAATTTMASSALVRDISGVCNSGETRLISSSPRNAANRKTNRFDMKSAGMLSSLSLFDRGWQPEKLSYASAHHFSVARHQRFPDDFILQIQLQLPVLYQVQQKCGDVFGVHLARVVRHGTRQVVLADDCHVVFQGNLIRFRQFAVPA